MNLFTLFTFSSPLTTRVINSFFSYPFSFRPPLFSPFSFLSFDKLNTNHLKQPIFPFHSVEQLMTDFHRLITPSQSFNHLRTPFYPFLFHSDLFSSSFLIFSLHPFPFSWFVLGLLPNKVFSFFLLASVGWNENISYTIPIQQISFLFSRIFETLSSFPLWFPPTPTNMLIFAYQLINFLSLPHISHFIFTNLVCELMLPPFSSVSIILYPKINLHDQLI